MSETSALGLAKLYQDNVWRYHRLPDSIISDRGPQFTAELMKELNKLLGIQTKLLTAYHPQTDGQTERMNQKIEQYLQLFISH
jgi:transposase InsO family protein